MNSRERILASVNHTQPDRVPIDLGATTSSGISAIAYSNVKRCFNITTGYTRVYDVVQQLAQPEDEILDKFEIDIVDIGRMYNQNESDWYEVELSQGVKAEFPLWFKPIRDADGNFKVFSDDGTLLSEMPKGVTYFSQKYFPCAEGLPESFEDLQQALDLVQWFAFPTSPWDHSSETNFWKELREKALILRKNTDRAVLLGCGCSFLEAGNFLRRMDNFLVDLYTSPVQVKRFLDMLLEEYLGLLEKVCSTVGDVVDIVRFSDDLGADQMPLIPPEKYREFFKPRVTELCNYVRKNSSMHTFQHCCGSIYKLIPDLIEAGIEIINPVQTSANEMGPVRLKQEFGKDITFWGGGCNTRTILNRSSPREVRDHVKRNLEILAPEGGFVFNQEHNIMPDVPPENILAMYEAIHEFSF